ncbi:MAG: hypothetical protein A2452_10705 [Candidatus Firestonebacteria bacterium RIFOXYC2_FULL_39_67]|nr:MAG: hypothetical protein A2536_01260 [Candidatus Firestonebacteria bacterium RIFOXYD2_FULL_39_29]OGF54162.1 MAG: hypothetical protein A2452_10705 [Candidatus Firestonebacteria bacterium RIFOXYC2_FULL_39_67]OGF57885.1 MAG: hypothetical protein A2497_00015 [Candidatus Firestonebacteria bacterium RifOxyC12_full_39_7]
MRNKRLLTYGVLTVIFLLLQSGFGEEPDLVQNKDVTAEISLDDSKTQQAEKHAEKIKQYLENLIFRIQEEDTETGELPEAGFSIVTNNLNLEKLIITGEKGRKYLFSLLKETKSGYTKERILREIYKDTADKELDEFTIETLYSVIKDKSSQIRFLTVRFLGEKGSSKSIPKINSLLYDSFVLRKDVYPVRVAAREAIELIKIREEAKTISEEERIKKWLQVIKEKSVLRQDYFCEKAVKEIALLVNGKESVWTELTSAKEMVGKKTLINNKIFSYLLLAASNLKDERVLPLIEESFKDPSLLSMAVRASAALSVSKTTDFLLKEPVNSRNAQLLMEALKEKLGEKEIDANPVPLPAQIAGEHDSLTYTGYDKESFDAIVKNVKQILLVKRNNEAYKDAAKMYLFGLNDFNRAQGYLSLYESIVKEAVSDDVYAELAAKCLANTGKFAEAKELFPLMDLKPYLINLKFLEMLTSKEIIEPVIGCRRNYLLVNAYLELRNYRKALSVLKNPKTADCTEVTEQFIKDKTALSEQKLKEETEEILSDLDTAPNEDITLEISTEKPEYGKEEEIKIKLLFKNTGSLVASGINDIKGNFGFDLLVIKEGRLIKKLKKDLSVIQGTEEQVRDIFTIDAGTALTSEIVAFSAAEDKIEQEVEIVLSYSGGPEITGMKKSWIKHPVISNELKIKIRK